MDELLGRKTPHSAPAEQAVIVQRTQYDLEKALKRAHLLEGQLIALDNIDEVIHIIRNSYDNAKQLLMARFGLDAVQAQAICDMRLIALQGLNREKLKKKHRELEERIADFRELLAASEKTKGDMKDDFFAALKKSMRL